MPTNQNDATADAGDVGDGDSPRVSEPTDTASENGGDEPALRDENARLKDQLLRVAADFDNYRKRSRREMADAERSAREEVLRGLLPVFDNLARAEQHASQATNVQSLAEGIQMVLNQFTEILERLGVTRIASVGEPFDPAIHEAVQQVESLDVPSGCIAAELLAGYRYGDRLVRPAMVVVAKAPLVDPSGTA